MPTVIIEVTINKINFKEYFRFDATKNAFVLDENTKVLKEKYNNQNILNALSQYVIKDTFYELEEKIYINKEHAEILLKIGFDYFKAVDLLQNTNLSHDKNSNQIASFDESTCREENDIFNSLIEKGLLYDDQTVNIDTQNFGVEGRSIGQSNANTDEDELSKLIRQGKLTITIDLKSKYDKDRKIIFKYDQKHCAYIFTNVEILKPGETLAVLHQMLYSNVFKRKFITSPLAAYRNEVLKINSIEEVKSIIQCDCVSYTIDSKINTINGINKNSIQTSHNTQVLLSSINKALTMHSNASHHNKITHSQYEKKQELLKIYQKESQRPGFNKFEEDLRRLLPSPEVFHRNLKGFYISIDHSKVIDFQMLLHGLQAEKHKLLQSLTSIHSYSIRDLVIYIEDIEKYLVWWNTPNPYCEPPIKRQRIQSSENINNNNENEHEAISRKSRVSPSS